MTADVGNFGGILAFIAIVAVIAAVFVDYRVTPGGEGIDAC